MKGAALASVKDARIARLVKGHEIHRQSDWCGRFVLDTYLDVILFGPPVDQACYVVKVIR